MIRQNTDPNNAVVDLPNAGAKTRQPFSMTGSRNGDILYAERRATVSVYLMCRVLVEIFNQSNLSSITPKLADHLVDILFSQILTIDPVQMAASPLRMANWRIYSRLLGIMSGMRFTSITSRFVSELANYQGDGNGLSKNAESKAELIVLCMRYISIKTTPEAWDESCGFMRSLARLFVSSHGQWVKQSYCYIFEKLLLSVAADTKCDLSTPKWKGFLDLVQPRLAQMLTKPRHWTAAFPLHVLLLCVSSRETFLSQWLSVIHSLPAKLKDRLSREPALQAVCRLVWTYFNRYPESADTTWRKIEEVIRIVIPPTKRTYLSTELAVSEPLTQLVRMIGSRDRDRCVKKYIFPLMNADIILSAKELRIEQMEPEKMVVGIRAFLALMADAEQPAEPCPSISLPYPFASTPTTAHIHRPQLLSEPRAPHDSETQHDSWLRSLNVSRLKDKDRENYLRFCALLGKITLVCDNAFGGQAALDEKFSGPTPKTPISEAFSFGRREEHPNTLDQKQAFYDLFHVAVKAMPRCLSGYIPLNLLINILCTGTAHVQSNIAMSSAESLKDIAQQSHAQQVTKYFENFIFDFDKRYSTMSDEGMLGPGHIESTLRLYVELLRIWIGEIRQKIKDATADSTDKTAAGSRALHLDLSNVLAHVELIEARGLFFLCSQSRRVRAFAITVLRLITEFDSALGQENTRIIQILEGDLQDILKVDEGQLSVAERSRIQKGKRRSAAHNTLIEICSSEVSYDSTLWSKVFPNVIRISFETCPVAVTLGREIINTKLVQMRSTIAALAESPPPDQYSHMEGIQARIAGRSNMAVEVLIEQWKLYLVMMCTTVNTVGARSQSQLADAQKAQHARKTSSRGARHPQNDQNDIPSARSLFASVIPLLSAERDSIRNAIVVALGSINKNHYRTLLESLQYAVTTCNEEAKIRMGKHVRTPSTQLRNWRTDRLRTEVTHVYQVTSHFLREPDVYSDDWIVNNLVTYTKDLRIFLGDSHVQTDWQFQRLRFHYCRLMEELFEGINRTKDVGRWMSFESRKSAFSLMEGWCGYSPNQDHISQERFPPVHVYEGGQLRLTPAAVEIEKKNLQAAALSAMASLCVSVSVFFFFFFFFFLFLFFLF